MAAVTLLELRTRIRQRTDNEHSGGFVSDDEINQLINLHNRALYGLLVRHGLQRSESVYSITANGSTSYALPVDMFALLGVYRVDTGSTSKIWLGRHDHRHRPSSSLKGDASTYRLVGGNIEFSPIPSTGSYELVYIPEPATLALDSDLVDGVLGWEEYIVLCASIDILQKEEADPTNIAILRERLAELVVRIVDEAKDVELSEHPTIQDVRTTPQLPGAYNVIGFRGSFRGFY